MKKKDQMNNQIRFIKFIILAVFLTVNSGFSHEQKNSSQEYILKVEHYLNGFNSLSANFIQYNDNAHSSSGRIYISKPGKLRLEYDGENKYLIVVKGGFISYYDKKLD